MQSDRRSTMLGLSALIAAAGLGLTTRAQAQSTMKLTTTAVNDLDQEWLTMLKNNLASTTGGKVVGQVYPASQLGSAQRTIEGVSMGTVEVAINASGNYESLEPRFGVFAVPGLFDSMPHGAKVLADGEVRRHLATLASAKGVEVITTLVHSPVGVVTRKPIRAIGDFKGQKIRVPGGSLLLEQLKQLGASPVSMSLGEVLPAFQNGTIDGVFLGTTIAPALKFYDVAKTMTLLPSSHIVIVGLVNAAYMKALGPLESVVRTAARNADASAPAWGEADVAKAQTAWTSNGGQMLTLPPADAQKFLELTIPAALAQLPAEGRKDYEFLRGVAARYR